MSHDHARAASSEDIGDLATEKKPERLTSLDIFRGITIAGMILVNNAGSGAAYPPLHHAEWDGLTPTDLVFPFFVFIIGVAIPLSFNNRRVGGSGTFGLILRILRRSFLIFGIGILLHAFPTFSHWDTIRIPGVLQRLSICYLCASLLALMFGPKTLAAIAATLLIGYTAAMSYVPIPGGKAGDLSRQGNLAAYVDRLLLPGHLYKTDYDPEGILSTIPAIASALLGVLAGLLLRSNKSSYEKATGLLVGGTAAALAGYVWSGWVPINKALWTSSFVLVSAGFALLLLGLLYWLVEIQGWKRWAWPAVVFGTNAIAAYILAALLARGLGMIQWGAEDHRWTPKKYLVDQVFLSFTTPTNASLLYSLSFVLTCFVIIYAMYRGKVFVKL